MMIDGIIFVILITIIITIVERYNIIIIMHFTGDIPINSDCDGEFREYFRKLLIQPYNKMCFDVYFRFIFCKNYSRIDADS